MTPNDHQDRNVIDVDQALNRVAGDRSMLHELVDIFLRESPGWIDEIDEAIAARDPDSLFRAAHDIKGSTQVFCAAEATQAAKQLERMGKMGDLDRADEALGALQTELVWVREALQAYQKQSS